MAVPIQSVTTRLPIGTPPKSDAVQKPEQRSVAPGETKPAEPVKPTEVVFAVEGDHVKMVPVKTGISDSDYFEIVSGLQEGQEIVAGGYKAISKDLEDGKKVKVGADLVKTNGESK